MTAPLLRLETTASTNDEALRLATDGAPTGSAVSARQQSAGRGRLGRDWWSPAGASVALSVVHRSRLAPSALMGLTLEAATAVAEVLAARGVAPEVKWPNDLLVGGLKIAGVLCELHLDLGAPGQGPVVIVGVGVNVGAVSFPPELAAIATSLARETGRDEDAEAFVDALLPTLRARLLGYEARGAPDLEAYARWSQMAGRAVVVRDAGFDEAGVALGVAPDGGLRVRVGGEERVVRSGEVSLAPRESRP